MKTTRRRFMQTSVAATAVGGLKKSILASPQVPVLRAEEIAKRHRIVRDIPGPSFFEGMLLGNGDVGVVAEVRPDALGLHVGKSDIWDIRVSEDIEPHILTFDQLLKLWDRASEAAKQEGKPDMLFLETNIDFFRRYSYKVNTPYAEPWPRPWPCGTIWIHWDPRWVHAGRQVLDPSNGLFTLELGIHEWNRQLRTVTVSTFVDWNSGLVSVSTDGPVPLNSFCYYPQVDRATKPFAPLPPAEIKGRSEQGLVEFSCFQYFPAIGPTREMPNPPKSDKDRNFSLWGRLSGSWAIKGLTGNRVELQQHGSQMFRMDLKVVTRRDILLEKLELALAESGEKNPWIMVSQNRSYSKEELDTASYARKALTRLAEVPVSEIQQDSEAC